jgi:hypothetical protein
MKQSTNYNICTEQIFIDVVFALLCPNLHYAELGLEVFLGLFRMGCGSKFI